MRSTTVVPGAHTKKKKFMMLDNNEVQLYPWEK